MDNFNRTGEYDDINSSQEAKNNAEIALRPVWQPLVDELITLD